ncbi:cytochrome c oxidase subunit 3 [Flavicella sp.]|uniref:cytochrome c oxidase subunit 3 n=1 Tax=Flavicella sp. TaxID=2957742 RepID=UPI00301A36F4
MMENSVDFELKEARRKGAKPMMWISMVSMTMMFAGLTSAYVISSNRDDWVSFDLPIAFLWSTLCIVLSSITFYAGKITAKKGNKKMTTIMLLSTLLLGLGFIYGQFQGFYTLQDMGLYFTGPKSAVSSSMLMVIVFAHVLHVLAGLISLLIVLYKQIIGLYPMVDTLGLELGEIFWHFLDFLWVGLFCFFYFNT